ncbi:unnamed protein product, partial [Brenthis ino]
MRVRTSVRQVLALLVRTGGWCSPDVIKARLVKCLALEDAYCACASGVVPEDAYYVCASGVVPEDAYYVCASGVVPEDAYYVCASGVIPEVVFSEHASGCNDENPDGVLYDYAGPTNVLSTDGTETNKNGGQTVATSPVASDEEVPVDRCIGYTIPQQRCKSVSVNEQLAVVGGTGSGRKGQLTDRHWRR